MAKTEHVYDCFLSYAKEDVGLVQQAYLDLRRAGLRVWMDKPPKPFEMDGLLPGEDWELAVDVAIEKAEYFIPFFSKTSVSKVGFVQREFRTALLKLAEMPHNSIYVLPVRLDKCDVPRHSISGVSFSQYQWTDCFDKDFSILTEFLSSRMATGPSRFARTETSATTADEVLDLVNSNVDVSIDGEIDLSQATKVDRRHVSLRTTFDGFEVQVNDVNGLRLGAKNKTEIFTPFSYSNVLSFSNSAGLYVENLRFGHRVPKGYCTGGVIKLDGCQEAHFSNCDFFGSGMQGVEINRCEQVTFSKCKIFGCTYGIGNIRRSKGIRFDRCEVYENEEYFGFEILLSENIIFQNCKFYENSVKGGSLFELIDSKKILLRLCDVTLNSADRLHSEGPGVSIEECVIAENAWQG